MEQYRKGEVFVAEIERLAGAAALRAAVGRPGDAADARRDRPTRTAGCGALGLNRARRRNGVTDGRPAGPGRVRAGRRARRRSRSRPILVGALARPRPRGDPRRPRPARGSSRSASTATPTGPLDDVEVHAPRPPPGRAVRPDPRPGAGAALGPLGDGGRRARPDARRRGRAHLTITNARGVFSRPDRRVRDAHDPGRLAPAARRCSSSRQERTWQPLESRELRDVTVGIVGLGSIGRAVGALATAFGCRVIATRRRPETSRRADRRRRRPATSRTSGR